MRTLAERARRLGGWLAAASLVLPPLAVQPGALDGFRLPQRMAAEWLALLSLVALALAGPAAEAVGERLATWRRPEVLVVAPLLLLAVLGLLTTRHPHHVGEALADLAIGATALVGWALCLDRTTLRRLPFATVVPGVVLAAIGVMQVHDLWQPVVFGVSPLLERDAMTALAGNPGDLATFLVLPCLLAQAALARGPRRPWWAGVLLLCTYALAATQTLTSFAALAAGSLLFWALWLPPRRALAGLAVGSVALVALVLGVAPLRERVLPRLEQVRQGDLNAVLSGRLDGWRVAAELVAERPLTGVGHGAYRAEFARAKLELTAGGEAFFGGHINPSFANAHNEYLELAADLGWPGVVALLGCLLVLLHRAVRGARRGRREERALRWAGLVAAAVLAAAYFPFRLGPSAFGWIAFLAWVLAGDELAEGEGQAGEADGETRPARRRLAVAALVLLALLAQTVRAHHRLRADRLLGAVRQQLVVAQQRGRMPPGLTRRAVAALDEAAELAPAAVEPLAFRGDLLLMMGRHREAAAAYELALAHEPRPETLLHHGLALAALGDSGAAVRQWRRAVALAPLLAAQLPPGAADRVAAAPLEPLPRLTRRAR